MAKKIAVVRDWYLPTTETFIYEELIRLQKFAPIVCAKKKMNLKRFPFKPIYTFNKPNQLKSIFKKQKVCLIHARFGTTGAKLLDVKNKLGLPMLTSFHGFDLPTNRKARNKYGKNLSRLFAEGDHFTVTSDNMKKILVRSGCPSKKITVHHSGIDIDRFSFTKRKKPRKGPMIILSVGRLVEKKGMNILINAFHKAQKEIPSLELRIAGDGPHQQKLKKQAKKLKITGKIKFLGDIPHKQVKREMNRAHVFALASMKAKDGNQEGIPNVLKEAMASGLPVVSTRHAGIPELVKDGQSGYLVPEKNSKKFANALVKLLRKPDKWPKMGKKGRATVVKEFNARKQVGKLEKLYGRMRG